MVWGRSRKKAVQQKASGKDDGFVGTVPEACQFNKRTIDNLKKRFQSLAQEYQREAETVYVVPVEVFCAQPEIALNPLVPAYLDRVLRRRQDDKTLKGGRKGRAKGKGKDTDKEGDSAAESDMVDFERFMMTLYLFSHASSLKEKKAVMQVLLPADSYGIVAPEDIYELNAILYGSLMPDEQVEAIGESMLRAAGGTIELGALQVDLLRIMDYVTHLSVEL